MLLRVIWGSWGVGRAQTGHRSPGEREGASQHHMFTSKPRPGSLWLGDDLSPQPPSLHHAPLPEGSPVHPGPPPCSQIKKCSLLCPVACVEKGTQVGLPHRDSGIPSLQWFRGGNLSKARPLQTPGHRWTPPRGRHLVLPTALQPCSPASGTGG
jgi:hypothetical protein